MPARICTDVRVETARPTTCSACESYSREQAIFTDEACDVRGRVDDGGVITAAEAIADLGKRAVGELPAEVHGDVSRIDDRPGSALPDQLLERDSETLGDHLLDPLHRDLGRLSLGEDVLQDLLRELDRNGAAGQRRERDDARQRSLELADVPRDATGDERQHLGIRDVDPVSRHLLAEDGDARLEVGRLNVDDEAPLEARAEALLERGDVTRRTVRGQDDLPAGLVEGVERVEELLLDPLLVLEELDVVDEEDIVVAVAVLEALDTLLADRVDEVVRERLARHVARGETRRVLTHVPGDRLEKVRLAETGPAVDEERVVRLVGRLGDGERRGMREAVGRADDEGVERVLVAETFHSSQRRRFRLRLGAGSLAHGQSHGSLLPDDVPDGRMEKSEEVALDPAAREVVRDLEDELVIGEPGRVDLAEPGLESLFAKGAAKPPGHLGPDAFRAQLQGTLHHRLPVLLGSEGSAIITAAQGRLNAPSSRLPQVKRRSL